MTGKNIQWIAVTGASAGLGAAISRKLADDGFGVIALARSQDKLAALAGEIEERGGSCVPVTCDVTDPASLSDAAGAIGSRTGVLSGLVNNAGTIAPIGPVLDVDPQAWGAAIGTNLIAVHGCIHAMAPVMATDRQAVIVNISSGASQRPLEGWSAYCASKAGLAMLTRSLHLEAADKVLAYGFQPGLVDTDMQVTIRASGINPVSTIPREQLLAPADPARIVAWLIRERPEDLRGTEFRADDDAIRTRAGLAPLGG